LSQIKLLTHRIVYISDRPESLCLIEIATGTSINDGGDATLFLFAGLANGVLMRIGVDPVTGQLAVSARVGWQLTWVKRGSDTRTGLMRGCKGETISVQLALTRSLDLVKS